MRITVFAATVFLLAGNVLAEPQLWMKKENPNELAVLVSDNPYCPDTQQGYADIVTGVLTRSRISLALVGSDVLLSVSVQCGGPAYSIDVHFGRWLEGGTVILFAAGYSSVGIYSNATYLRTVLRETVEEAITDYLQANFDL